MFTVPAIFAVDHAAGRGTISSVGCDETGRDSVSVRAPGSKMMPGGCRDAFYGNDRKAVAVFTLCHC